MPYELRTLGSAPDIMNRNYHKRPSTKYDLFMTVSMEKIEKDKNFRNVKSPRNPYISSMKDIIGISLA